MFSFSKAPSLAQKLVHSHFDRALIQSGHRADQGFFSCGKCRACLKTKYSVHSYLSFDNRRNIPIHDHITCHTEFVVYMLVCPCGLRYIGSSRRQVVERIREHRRAIKNVDRTYPVAVHCATKHASDPECVRFIAIKAVPASVRGGNREL